MSVCCYKKWWAGNWGGLEEKKKEPSDHVKGKTGEQREWVKPFVRPPSSCHPSAAGVELLKCRFRKTAATQRVSDCSARAAPNQLHSHSHSHNATLPVPYLAVRQQRVHPSSPLGVWENGARRLNARIYRTACSPVLSFTIHTQYTAATLTCMFFFFSSWSLGNAEWWKYRHTQPRQDHRSDSSAVFSRGIDTCDEWSLEIWMKKAQQVQ